MSKNKLVAGIDIGSYYTKTVVLDIDENIISSSVVRSGASYKDAADRSLYEALHAIGLKANDVCYTISTGYGRALIPMANAEVTEITCHARGVNKILPQTRTIIDIGGQDSKVIYLIAFGGVGNFIMNDKCAAGTGRFLEVTANVLGVGIEEMSELSFQSQEILEISSVCTVFAESEIISLLAKGCQKEDIVAALFRSIARRVAGMVYQIGVQEPVTMTGGVAQSAGMIHALEKQLNTKLLIPEQPQLTGALGAAIIAAARVKRMM